MAGLKLNPFNYFRVVQGQEVVMRQEKHSITAFKIIFKAWLYIFKA